MDKKEMTFTEEQLVRARKCASAEELLALAKENGTELTEEEARLLFERMNPENGEIADEELDAVSGGCGGDSSANDIPEGSRVKSLSGAICPWCGYNVATYTGTVHKSTGVFSSEKTYYTFTCCRCRKDIGYDSSNCSIENGVDFQIV